MYAIYHHEKCTVHVELYARAGRRAIWPDHACIAAKAAALFIADQPEMNIRAERENYLLTRQGLRDGDAASTPYAKLMFGAERAARRAVEKSWNVPRAPIMVSLTIFPPQGRARR